MNQTRLSVAGRLLTLAASAAGETRTWVETDYSDFEKGNIKKLSLRSDGRLTLAPAVRRSSSIRPRPTCGRWRAIPRATSTPAAVPAPSCTASRPTAKRRRWPNWTAWRSTPSPSIPRTASTPPPRRTARSIASRGDGKPEVFYDPKAKYIWALAFDGQGDLFVATGDQGEIHRVTPDGKGTVFFKTEETHVRSLAMDGHGNLIAGHRAGRPGPAHFARRARASCSTRWASARSLRWRWPRTARFTPREWVTSRLPRR